MVQLLDGNSAEIVLIKKATDEQPSVQPAETDDETDFDNTEIERDLARDAARDVANTSLEQLAVSPLKTHSLSKQ